MTNQVAEIVTFKLAPGISEADFTALSQQSEAFVRAWRKLDSFRGNSRFGTWLHRIAINMVVSEKRSRWARHVESLDSEDGGRLEDMIASPQEADPGDAHDQVLLRTTLERSLRAVLIESRQRFKDLVDLAADVREDEMPEPLRLDDLAEATGATVVAAEPTTLLRVERNLVNGRRVLLTLIGMEKGMG